MNKAVPLKVVAVVKNPLRGTIIRIWEMEGSESEFPFLACEVSLN